MKFPVLKVGPRPQMGPLKDTRTTPLRTRKPSSMFPNPQPEYAQSDSRSLNAPSRETALSEKQSRHSHLEIPAIRT